MRQHNTEQPTTAMVAAITESDNAAAESIWEGLGDPAAAAIAVGDVLHDTGDPTIVESRKLRPEYTAFGQTDWSLTNQALFLSAAACDPRDQPALDLMGQVNSDQRVVGRGTSSRQQDQRRLGALTVGALPGAPDRHRAGGQTGLSGRGDGR